MHINDNILRLRKLTGLSQQQIADLIAEKRSTYAEWEKETPPQADVLIKLANALKTTVAEILAIPGQDDPALQEKAKAISSVNGDKYVMLLEKNNEVFSEMISSGLVALVFGQQSLLANVEAGNEYQLDREAAGDKKKAELMKKELDKRIGEKLGAKPNRDKDGGM